MEKNKKHSLLLKRFNDGDKKAVYEVFEMYAGGIIPFITMMVKDTKEVEDILTESFMKLLQSRAKFERLEQVNSFLFKTAKRKAFDYLAHKKLWPKIKEYLLESASPDTTDIETADEHAYKLRLIVSEIQKLPNKCRQICLLSLIEGLSDQEVAARLGLSIKTVANQKNIGIKKLRIPLFKLDRNSFEWFFAIFGSSDFFHFIVRGLQWAGHTVKGINILFV